jgi:hypothetical protein
MDKALLEASRWRQGVPFTILLRTMKDEDIDCYVRAENEAGIIRRYHASQQWLICLVYEHCCRSIGTNLGFVVLA